MIERVERISAIPSKNFWLGTFHSICVRILRQEADRWDYPRNFTIYDRDDQISLIKKTLKRYGVSAEKMYPPSKVLHIIGRAKNNGIPPERLHETMYGDEASVYEELYRQYNESLRNSGAFDFDDLLLKPVDKFGEDKESLKKWQNRFSFILVDEYQDTNRVQYNLMRLLCGGSGNVTVVGDDDQSIYGWRGADIQNILDFESEFKGVKTIRLEQNYRSTGHILETANTVITHNRNRMRKRLWTEIPEGEKVRVYESGNEREEAQCVVDIIKKEREEKEFGLRDFAILYRTNSQSRVFEEALMKSGTPYVLVGGTRFYERKEIKDILAYLRLAANPGDTISFGRAITVPRRGIGQKTVEAIERFAENNRMTLLDSIARADEFLSPGMAAKLKIFHAILQTVNDMRGKSGLDELVMEILDRIDYETYIRDAYPDNAEDRIDNINELIGAMRDFVNETDEDNLSSFLAEVSLVSDIDGWDEKNDAVTLMTLHSAKGLEFPSVFVTGVEDRLFPLERSSETDEELEEERRLFYVGITRAKELLHVSYACSRLRYGSFSGGSSMFIDELPKQTIEFEISEPPRFDSYRQSRQQKPKIRAFEDYSQEAPDYTDYDDESSYRIGTFIRHPKFGRGKITAVSGNGDNCMLTIMFGASKKKIMAKYAKLSQA